MRNGLVLHFAIEPGAIKALVRGSSLYTTSISISPIARRKWKSICTDLAGGIDSLVDLLQVRFSAVVMERLCRQGTGLFPTPAEIRLDCSCPDSASMCKHVAAVLYGIGARLDVQPELLFTLRQVDARDLIASANDGATLARRVPGKDRLLESAMLAEIIGLEMAMESGAEAAVPQGKRERLVRGKKKPKRATKGKRAKKTKGARKKRAS